MSVKLGVRGNVWFTEISGFQLVLLRIIPSLNTSVYFLLVAVLNSHKSN